MSSGLSETCEWADQQVVRSLNSAENLLRRLAMTRPSAHKKQTSVLLRSDSKVRVMHKSMSPASYFRSTVPEKGDWTSRMNRKDAKKHSKNQEEIDIAHSHRNATCSGQPLHKVVSQTSISICTSDVKVVSSSQDSEPAVDSTASPVSPELNLNSPLPQPTNNVFMPRVNMKEEAIELESDHSAVCSSCIFAEQLDRINKYEAVFFKPYNPAPMRRELAMNVVDKKDRSLSLSPIEYNTEYCNPCNLKMQKSNVKNPNKFAIVTRPPIESLENSKKINMTVGFFLKFPDGHQKFIRVDCEIADFKAKRVRVISEEKGKKSESYQLSSK
ncbi:hypothetical protein M3Y95_00337100 [Aphelenchoides besseyi]|nr:hypothetical protein M3Y95_00337100 [Aphelenchoides besseyi]